jgi:DNA-binding transcriptional MerR regulator
MQIGELAKRSGLTASQIRFYEAQGLISVGRRANGYRAYPDEALIALNIITSAQNAGFTLKEIRRLMPGDLSRGHEMALLGAPRQKVDDISAMERRLAQTRSAARSAKAPSRTVSTRANTRSPMETRWDPIAESNHFAGELVAKHEWTLRPVDGA